MILRTRQEAVADPLALDVLARLPLADAVLSLYDYVLQPDFLDGVFDRHRGRSFQDVLTFPTFVNLIGEALLRYQGRGRPSLNQARQAGALPTTSEAVYGKLRRLPLGLSLGFLEDVATRLVPLLPPGTPVLDLPDCFRDLLVVVGAGKGCNGAARRRLGTRGAAGKLTGARLLVAYVPAWGLAVAMAADRDGEANEARLVPALLSRLEPCRPAPRLWVLDRQFCDLVQIGRLTDAADHFLIRYHKKVAFVPDPDRPARVGTDSAGRVVRDEWGWLGAASNRGRRYVRRLTVQRPGAEAISVVTDLLDPEAFPAADLLALYRKRWGIERVFQEVTELFGLKQLIGSTPEATIFQAAFCLVLYNLMQVVRQYAAEVAPPSRVDEISLEQVVNDSREDLT